MSTRQYIGARYTPKFSGTYDATQAYEALEVVDNGSGTTYIAKKPVPPNIPLTNTEYWLVYGSSSGAILDLQTRVNTIENTDLPAIDSSINNINGSILTMGGQIDTINNVTIPAVETEIDTKINVLKPSISSIGEFVRQYANKKILIVGDSLSIEPGTWVDTFRTMAEANGCTVRNISGGGYRAINAYNALVNETDAFDIALVWLGVNDSNQGTNVGGIGVSGSYVDIMKNIFEQIYTLNSACKIFAFSLTWYDNTFSLAKSTFYYTSALYSLCKMYGVVFKNISDFANTSLNHHASIKPNDPTNVHFTETAQHTMVYSTILNKILTQVSDTYIQSVLIYDTWFTAGSNVRIDGAGGDYVLGNVVSFNMEMTIQANLASGATLATVVSQLYPARAVFGIAIDGAGNSHKVALSLAGAIVSQDAISAGTLRLMMSFAPAIGVIPGLS